MAEFGRHSKKSFKLGHVWGQFRRRAHDTNCVSAGPVLWDSSTRHGPALRTRRMGRRAGAFLRLRGCSSCIVRLKAPRMTAFDLTTILMTFVAVVGWLNVK